MTEAFPMTDEQRAAAVYQQKRRRTLHTMAAKDSDAHGSRLARKLLAENGRAFDSPVDVARRVLQRRGYRPVYNAAVVGGDPAMWIVGSRTMSTAEMIAAAAG